MCSTTWRKRFWIKRVGGYVFSTTIPLVLMISLCHQPQSMQKSLPPDPADAINPRDRCSAKHFIGATGPGPAASRAARAGGHHVCMCRRQSRGHLLLPTPVGSVSSAAGGWLVLNCLRRRMTDLPILNLQVLPRRPARAGARSSSAWPSAHAASSTSSAPPTRQGSKARPSARRLPLTTTPPR